MGHRDLVGVSQSYPTKPELFEHILWMKEQNANNAKQWKGEQSDRNDPQRSCHKELPVEGRVTQQRGQINEILKLSSV